MRYSYGLRVNELQILWIEVLHSKRMEKKTRDIDTQWNAVHRKFYKLVSSRLSNETNFL